MNLDNIRKNITEALTGLVVSLGDASVHPEIISDPNGRDSVVVLRDGYKLQQLPGQNIGRRTHVFEDAESMAAWLVRHAKPEQVEVLVGAAAIKAALDPANPTGDIVTCPLALHPRWKRWAGLLNGEVSQPLLHRHFLGALEDFGQTRMAVAGHQDEHISTGELLAIQLAKFEAVRNVEVKIDLDDRGFARFSGTTDKLEIRGQLPPRFTIAVPMLLGVQDVETGEDRATADQEATYEIELFLGIVPQEKGGPKFVLRCPSLEVKQREARVDAVRYLRFLLAEQPFLVGLGEVGLETVPLVAR